MATHQAACPEKTATTRRAFDRLQMRTCHLRLKIYPQLLRVMARSLLAYVDTQRHTHRHAHAQDEYAKSIPQNCVHVLHVEIIFLCRMLTSSLATSTCTRGSCCSPRRWQADSICILTHTYTHTHIQTHSLTRTHTHTLTHSLTLPGVRHSSHTHHVPRQCGQHRHQSTQLQGRERGE